MVHLLIDIWLGLAQPQAKICTAQLYAGVQLHSMPLAHVN
jgi:hypothetical protein